MLRRSEDQADGEASRLAPYAQKVADSAGRTHPEAGHALRSAYQRDRARVVHSRSFRRLEAKTQVFFDSSGDHYRNRLTHTIEVASIARTAASALGLNEDLTEVVALAHDLGHPPVGHAGEETLDRLMRGHGGFDHNRQSLRIVERVECVYPDFDGLNLTWEVREGLRKHETRFERPAVGDGKGTASAEAFSMPSLEAQVADLADEITYSSHDLDDGLDRELLTEADLERIELWRECAEQAAARHPGLTGNRRRAFLIRALIDREVDDLVATTLGRVEVAGVRHADDVRRCGERLAAFSPRMAAQNRQLRAFLFEHLYLDPRVASPTRRGCAWIEEVFAHYVDHPEELGRRTIERLSVDGLHRTVCDYVSGMTDRFLRDEIARLGRRA